MIRVLDLEGGPRRQNHWRAARLPLALLVTVGMIGALVGGTLTSRSARAASAPSMEVSLSASSPEVAGSGGRVLYTYTVTNTSDAGSLELLELSDDLLGQLDGAGTCSLPQTIALDAPYSCVVAVDLVDRAGSTITTTLIAMAFAEDGTELVETATETVTATTHARLIIDHSGAVRPTDESSDDSDDELLGGGGLDLGDGGLFGDDPVSGPTVSDDDELLGGDHDEADQDEVDPDTDDFDTDDFDDADDVPPAELGTSTRLRKAPKPIECGDGVEWRATPGLHMGAFRSAELTVDTSLTLDPGVWSIEDLVLHDADIDRPFYPQADERLRIEFWHDETLAAATASTPDLIDGDVSAWLRGGLGSVELANGADRVLLVHSNLFDGTTGTNSFEPHSLCLTTRAPSPPPLDELGDTDPDQPDTDQPADDELDGDDLDNDDLDSDESDLEDAPEQSEPNVDFTIVIENVGTVAVFGLTITDIPVDELRCDGDTDRLGAGQTLTCTGTYLATPDEVLHGSIQSTIRVDTLQTLPRTASTRVSLPGI